MPPEEELPYPELPIRHQQVGVGSRSDRPLLPRLAQDAGGIFGEEAQRGLQRELFPLHETAQLRQKVGEIIASVNPEVTFHDFRVVSGPTHTNLIFDIVSPMDCKLSDKELAKAIADKIHEYDPTYFAVIDVDKDFASYQARKE